jgi:Cys-tRNA(Pro)/Cys-tRNA(Cys) deacylase
LRTVIDTNAVTLEQMFVSGGRRGLEIAVRPADLSRLCRTLTATISKP